MIVAEDKKGWTVLHSAADQGSSEAVLSLLKHGAECNKLAPRDHDRTSLHLAAENGTCIALLHGRLFWLQAALY